MKTKKYLYLFLVLIFAVNCWGQNWFHPIQKAAKKGDAEAQFKLVDVYRDVGGSITQLPLKIIFENDKIIHNLVLHAIILT